MSDEKAKIEIKIGEIQIQLEGSSDFVSNQYDKIEKHLENYVKLAEGSIQRKNNKEIPSEQNIQESTEIVDVENSNQNNQPASFGEWLNRVPKGTNDTSKALLAGYFQQLNSEPKSFKSRDVSKILKDHSIKLSNTSQLIKNLVDTKKIFQVSKTGNESNFRVSRETEIELKGLLK